jgi:hypothetical protein
MSRNAIGWLLWIPGLILVALSWGGVVSPTVGWVGFAAAWIGFLLPRLIGRADPPPDGEGSTS